MEKIFPLSHTSFAVAANAEAAGVSSLSVAWTRERRARGVCPRHEEEDILSRQGIGEKGRVAHEIFVHGDHALLLYKVPFIYGL